MADQLDFVIGDATGMKIPAHMDALMKAGPSFLTQAFRRFGVIAPDNSVIRIAGIAPCLGGSTGQKFFLTLDYAAERAGLERTLFLKFSRDFNDDRRDWQRTEMEGEARFVALSREPGFPIRVPAGYFADYHAATGTGIVITERVGYGEGGIEPHRRKCLDWQTMADPLPYYRATVITLAGLAAAHKSGAMASDIDRRFPWDPITGSADPIGYSADQLEAELEHCRAFARDCPQLMPPHVCSADFMAKLSEDARLILENEAQLRAFLIADPAMIALNHWNSHIDNCWFWRDAGELHCGLIDWGRVGQITFGSALWGGLSAAHHDIWDCHLDPLLLLFLNEYHGRGGPDVGLSALKRHLFIHMAVMGVARVLAFPEIIRYRLPQCTAAADPRDPMFEPVTADPARNCLSIYTVLLKTWHREDFGRLVRELVG